VNALARGALSVRHLYDDAVERYRSRPAVTGMGTTLSYGEVDRLARDFAAYLQQELCMTRGQRLAVMLPNVLQYPVVLFGAFLAGLTVVNVNLQHGARELQRQLLDAGVQAIMVLEDQAHVVQAVLRPCALRAVIVCRWGDLQPAPGALVTSFAARHLQQQVPAWAIPQALCFADIVGARRGRDLEPVALGPRDIAFLQYTSGTTGTPRGAVLTHGNVVANMLQHKAWAGGAVREGAEIVVTPMPLHHVLSLMVNLLAYFNFGGHAILVADPRHIDALVQVLQRSRFSVITGVNALYRALLDAPGFAGVDVSHLKCALAGGAAVQPAVAARWQQATGVPLVEGYGLTECGMLTCNRLDSAHWSGDVGLPYPSTEISIRDDAGLALPAARSARSAPAARRSCRATGTAPTTPRAPSPPTAGSAPATSAAWAGKGACAWSTAGRT